MVLLLDKAVPSPNKLLIHKNFHLMGKINQGILGGVSGKVGNVIGGNWKGIDYIRVKPSNVANPRTAGQVMQRTKFTVTLEFLQAIKPFVKAGYRNLANKKTEFNAAMSYILNNAITGVDPDYIVDYTLALLSRGGLSMPLNPSADASTSDVWLSGSPLKISNLVQKNWLLHPMKNCHLLTVNWSTKSILSNTRARIKTARLSAVHLSYPTTSRPHGYRRPIVRQHRISVEANTYRSGNSAAMTNTTGEAWV